MELNIKKDAEAEVNPLSAVGVADTPVEAGDDRQGAGQASKSHGGLYARYVLIVLLLVYVLNIVDRNILAILAEDIKADLNITDANLGFLFGTAFAVFYATFGIAFGRLADVWNRKKLIAAGLTVWSVMTALSGLMRSFLPLAACRFGVGVGEASATPAAFSLLYDYFSPKVRTTVIAIYDSGIYIGAGLALLVGGSVIGTWKEMYPDPSQALFGLRGWQVAFMVVGLPGLLMAVWASTLKEPVRGQNDGIADTKHPHPFREAFAVIASMVPVFNLWALVQTGGGKKAVLTNIAMALAVIIGASVLTALTGSVAQWVALGIGVYAVVSWAQGLAVRDPVIFGLIFRCKTILFLAVGGAAPIFAAAGIGFWSVPFFQRFHDVTAAEVGSVLGTGNLILGFSGVIIGGLIADKLRQFTSAGKLYVIAASLAIGICTGIGFLTAGTLTTSYGFALVGILFGAMGVPAGASVMNDLMLPRGRATVGSLFLMVKTVIGTALGPYVIGKLSDTFTSGGLADGEALRQAMLWSLLMSFAGFLMVLQAIRHIKKDEDSLIERARALGEPI